MRERILGAGSVAVVLFALLPSGSASGESPRPWELRTYGSLRGMFHEDQVGPAVNLDEVLPNRYLYGVGALSNLAGEITVIAGSTYVSLPVGADSSCTRRWSEGLESACLLVTAEVSEWLEMDLEDEIDAGGLDRTLAQMAKSAGLDVDEAFPFVIEGELRDLSWHVIDGERLEAGGSSHSDHLKAAARSYREQTPATLIGFYSPRDHGIFTHMGSNTHMHCVLEDPLATGHVDDVILPAGTRIRLPATDKKH